MDKDVAAPAQVLLIHQAFASPAEPGGTRHFELARQLIPAGFRFTVIGSTVSCLTGQSAGTTTEIDGMRILRAWSPAVHHRSFAWRVVAFVSFMVTALWPALRCGRVDLVMGTSPPLFQALTAWCVAALRRRPLLLEIRDLWPEFAIEMGVLKNPVLIWLSRQLERFLYWRATHLLVNSPAYRDYLLRRGLPAAKITFIANGVDPEMFANVTGTFRVRAELGLAGKCVVTYAGALGAANDISTILDAAAQLADDPSIQIVLAGDGKERRPLEAAARQRGLSNVLFAGARPKKDMPALLAASDICLATLRDIPMFRTTYPNKVFDYMAASRPTVLAIDGVIRDVIEAAQGGLFVPPGDSVALANAIRRLRLNPHEREQMGRNARAYVQRHFHRGQQAQDLAQLLARLTATALPAAQQIRRAA